MAEANTKEKVETIGEKQALLKRDIPDFICRDVWVPTQIIPVTRRITVEPIVLFYFMAVSASQPFLQQYVYSRISEKYGYVDPNSAALGGSSATLSGESNTSSCQSANVNESDILYQQVQSETAKWNVVLNAANIVPLIISTLLLGPLSDRKGRKVCIIPPMSGSFIKAILIICVVYRVLPLECLIVGAVAEGISGGIGAAITGCFAYMADLSLHEERLYRIMTVEILVGISNATALLSLGYLIQALGFVGPILIISCLHFLCLIYSLFLPETLQSTPISYKLIPYLMLKPILLFVKDDGSYRRGRLILCIITFIIFMTIEIGGMDIMTYFFLNPPICVASTLIGVFGGVASFIRGVGSFLTIKLLKKWIPEMGIALFGVMSDMTYYLQLSSVTEYMSACIGEFNIF